MLIDTISGNEYQLLHYTSLLHHTILSQRNRKVIKVKKKEEESGINIECNEKLNIYIE